MLSLYVEGTEYYDEKTNTFFSVEGETLYLEHSLYSLSLWEAEYEKSLLDALEKGLTAEELKYYIECMTIKEPINKDIYLCINQLHIEKIKQYINKPMSATTFTEFTKKNKYGNFRKKEIITSEIIYYWMLESEIPFECDKWNLNHLISLIRVVSIKHSKNNNMPRKEAKEMNRALMAQRRAAHK